MAPDTAPPNDPDRLIPPYDDRSRGTGSSQSSRDLRETVERQLAETDGPGRPGATSSPADERPVGAGEVSHGSRGAGQATATDPYATSAQGVGQSMTRRGEDVKKQEGSEPGRTDEGTKGQSQRPHGTSDERDSTGVDPRPKADPQMPNTFTGDQGG
ncbi:MAG: hypothetical protein AB1673_10435 [Actinomycetota bacterium]|jgi:hypothetical protein